MGPNVPLDTILKKFTIVYGNVKSFDLLMRDVYHADQGEEESIPSFATRMEGLLSWIRDKYLEKFTHPEKQRLLKDQLFHGCKKSIWDSVKYCFADPHMDYMQFLEECRKVEDEDKVGQIKVNPPKAKVAAATVPPTREDELTKQLRYQQHQIDTLVGQVKNLVSAVKPTRASSRGATTGGARMPTQSTWRGVSRGRGPLGTTPQSRARDPQVTQGACPTYKCWQCGKLGHIKRKCPTLKEQELFQKGECFNSPMSLESHSPVDQPSIETSEEKEANRLAQGKNNPWSRLIGRANEEQIVINGHPVTALLDTGSQVTHISEAFYQANNIQIHPLDKLVEIEGTGGTLLNI